MEAVTDTGANDVASLASVDISWIRIRSWHAVSTPTRMFNTYVTVCGRRASGSPVDVLPGGRSCETCLRIVARRVDQ